VQSIRPEERMNKFFSREKDGENKKTGSAILIENFNAPMEQGFFEAPQR
jgi:hypothetical protein